MDIFEMSKGFPKEEKYSLIDQIRKPSRSVCSNIAEAYHKRRYPKHFTSKISDADGEPSEITVWIDFAFDCKYINEELKKKLSIKYEEVGKMLGGMANNPEKFLPKYHLAFQLFMPLLQPLPLFYIQNLLINLQVSFSHFLTTEF
jgi:four helix bundle protein